MRREMYILGGIENGERIFFSALVARCNIFSRVYGNDGKMGKRFDYSKQQRYFVYSYNIDGGGLATN